MIIGASAAAPSNPAVVGGYHYAGCYSDNAVARVLTGKSTAGSTVNLEACAAFCISCGYNIFGVEYAEKVGTGPILFDLELIVLQCYCGNTLASTSVNEADTDCSMNCAANSAEFCGAGSRLSLYMRNGTSAPSAASSTVSTKIATGSSTSMSLSATLTTPSSNSAFVSWGCYTDNTVTARSLVGGATSSSSVLWSLLRRPKLCFLRCRVCK